MRKGGGGSLLGIVPNLKYSIYYYEPLVINVLLKYLGDQINVVNTTSSKKSF